MSQPLPVVLERIQKAAELGLKHSQGRDFPIDRMAACLQYIIEQVEKHNGTRST